MKTILQNSKKDWQYIILSPIAGFLLIGLYLLIKLLSASESVALLCTFLFYAIFFDVRHLFSTYSRTFIDRTYFQENKKWLIGTFLMIIGIPLLTLLAIRDADYYFGTGAVLLFIFRITTVLGLYHLIKQNWGFVAIYKKKNGELKDKSERWEKLLLLSGSFLPLIILTIQSPAWFEYDKIFLYPEPYLKERIEGIFMSLAMLSLAIGVLLLLLSRAKNAFVKFHDILRNLGFYFCLVFLSVLCFLHYGVSTLYLMLGMTISIFFVSLFLVLYYGKGKIEWKSKKWALILSSLLLYNGVLLSPIENKFILIMAITIPHNIQYLAFVNFFNQKYYNSDRFKNAFIRTMSQKIGVFILVSLIYALVYELLRTGTKYLDWGDPKMNYIVGNFIAVFFLSMSLHHYFLDAVIWRVRTDKSLSSTV